MISDSSARVLVDNMGWVDKGALWLYDADTRRERLLAIDGCEYLTIRAGADGLFRLTHHGSPEQSVSIRHVANPQQVLASVSLEDAKRPFKGDVSLWGKVETALIFRTGSTLRLVRINADTLSILDLDLRWFKEGPYDLLYQGLVDCLTPPHANFIVVSVQRSSKLVLLDHVDNRKCGHIDLAGRGGNPSLRLKSHAELLASDYDTMCRVDLNNATVIAKARLQESGPSGTRSFIGDYAPAMRNTIAVARPFSGDVILVDAATFARVGQVVVPGQPLRVAVTPDGDVITRDWKSGTVSQARF